MFRVPFKVIYGAVITWKKEIFKKKISENHPPTRHLKYKVINFAPSNKSTINNQLQIMAKKLPSTNLERFLRHRLIETAQLLVMFMQKWWRSF